MRTSSRYICGMNMSRKELTVSITQGIVGAAVLYGVFFAAIAILNTLEGIIK